MKKATVNLVFRPYYVLRDNNVTWVTKNDRAVDSRWDNSRLSLFVMK